MQQMLKADEAIAGTKKEPHAFKIPIKTEASAANNKNGDIIRVN